MYHNSTNTRTVDISKFNKSAKQDETHSDNVSSKIDVYTTGIFVDDADMVTIRPNIITSEDSMVKDPMPENVVAENAVINSQTLRYQSELETQKRIQQIRTRALLHQYNAPKKMDGLKQSSDSWKLVIAYAAAILLLVLLVGPFFSHVASALSAF